MERRSYVTDDLDLADGPPMELSLFQGNNGDWYLSVEPKGTRMPRHVVRITTSGSMRPCMPGVMRDLFEAMATGRPTASAACPCCGVTR